MVTLSTRKRAVLALALLGTTIVAGTDASRVMPAAHAMSLPTTTSGLEVYQGKLTCCQHLALGSVSRPTLVVQTPLLPAGKYLVSAIANAVIADKDQVVCALAPSNQPGTNDGIVGTAGNGAGTMGDGGMIDGTATIADVWQIIMPETSLQLICNTVSTDFSLGTYVSAASITALYVGPLPVTSR